MSVTLWQDNVYYSRECNHLSNRCAWFRTKPTTTYVVQIKILTTSWD